MWLGIDLGTSSMKMGLVDSASKLCWLESKMYKPDYVGAHVEIDPKIWWEACGELGRRIPNALRSQITGIGLSGQMHSLVLVNHEGELLRKAILWPDRRASAHTGVFDSLAKKDPSHLANPVVAGMPGPIFRWLREFEPYLWDKPFTFLSPKDWIRSQLTNESEPATDHSDASATLLYDARSNDWSAELADQLQLGNGSLPPIFDSRSVAGELSVSAARHIGVASGVPVSVGAGDSAAALVGSAIKVPGTGLLNIGTGGQAMMLIDGPVADVATKGIHNYRTAEPVGSWYVMSGVVNCGLALGWVCELLNISWPDLYRNAESALEKVDDDPVFAPFLSGERDPEVGLHPSGAWLNLSIDHDAASLARSALVGVAAYLSQRMSAVGALTVVDRIVLSGGSTKSAGWVQLVTDLLGHSVEMPEGSHASVRGAAILAAQSQGVELAVPELARRFEPQATLSDRSEIALRRLESAIQNRI